MGSTDESVEYATRALGLSWANLEAAVHRPTPDVRRAMLEAAHWAGKAINISKTTAPHALSYWVTTRYGIPHGAAVAVFLGPMWEYNAQVSSEDCNDPRGPRHVQERIALLQSQLEVSDPKAGRHRLEELIAAIGCPVALRAIGIASDADVIELAKRVNVERLSNNPRRVTSEQLLEILLALARV